MQSRLKASEVGNQVGGNQPDESFCEKVSCWFQTLQAIRPSAHEQLSCAHADPLAHDQQVRCTSNPWMHCVSVTYLPRESICFQAQLEFCPS